ncbi:PAS domain-containing protein [Nisaea acidiphila]|uniref:PAS domain-containing protein n=1 Tax=Nisaea acidiphila TaxID=1862145 RepID=A0A9J7ARK7_9PROT|nr:PAS domain-containing protein [Nisaea acidiphila]UUX49506.1 PAS domain-containing protein [Nisaea acidiphila]
MTPEIVWGSARDERRLLDAETVPARHPVRLFHEYYLSRRERDGYLDRKALDPAELVTLLPWVQILEEMEDGSFNHRLIGTAVTDLVGLDNTGKPFGYGISDDFKELRLEEFQAAFRTGDPVFSRSSLMQDDRSFITVIRGVFPGKAGRRRLVYMPLAAEEKRLYE